MSTTIYPEGQSAPPDGTKSYAAESLFLSWNVAFQLVERPLEQIRIVDDAQVRDVRNVAPAESIDRYATMLANGATFPAIVTRNGGILVDGYTRFHALKKTKTPTVWCYEITTISNDLAKTIAAALNAQNGNSLTLAEAQAAALVMLEELQFSDEAVARYLGRTGFQVRQWRRAAETSARANRLGMGVELGRLSSVQRDLVAGVTHDEPFAATMRLVSEVKPTREQLRSLVGDIREATSDAAALEAVAVARSQWTPQGPEPAKVIVNTKARRARMIVGQVMKLKPIDVYDPSNTNTDLAMWRSLVEHAARVIGLLEAQSADGGEHNVA